MARSHLLVLLCTAILAGPGPVEAAGASSPAVAESAPSSGLSWFAPERRGEESDLERALLSLPSAESLAAAHDMISSRPHVAGSAADLAVVDKLATSFERMGLEVERYPIWPYLPHPVAAQLEIVSPQQVALEIKEREVEGDKYAIAPGTDIGWNAYSADGDVTAGVVYANYGTRDDFERLSQLGVDVTGKIVVARYGRIFRGHKVRFAERAGAAGVILYGDPEDDGYVKGLMYPEGGWANDSYIQRGSILVLPYSGDPLTPFEPATRDAERLDPADVGLPSIPVQPIGWGAASKILSRMTGPVVPEEWQGGLPYNYRLTGGDGLRLRLRVDQEASLTETYNVLARLRGARYPNELVLVGAHHDAWSFGAGDPNAGTIVVHELARTFSELARRGWRPDRTLVFAAWGAEEFGIIGSVEWVESQRQALGASAVSYINLDGAAMGPDFAASAAPLLKQLVLDAAADVPALDGDGSVLEAWRERTGSGEGEPPIGDLGGGSDHVGFYCHLGIPSAGISGQGSSGVSYHSNYENLAWYRQVVGDDYEPAMLLTRVVGLMLARLANADLIPFSFPRYGDDLARHAAALADRVEGDDRAEITSLSERGKTFGDRAAEVDTELRRLLGTGRLAGEPLERVDAVLLHSERTWLAADGLPGRPWFRNLFAATDEDAGYAAWMLPRLRWAVERGEPIPEAVRAYERVLDALDRKLDLIEEILEPIQ